MKWSYAVTTVPQRRNTTLPATLRSLSIAGFPEPRLMVDGDSDSVSWKQEFGLQVTARYPRIGTYGNWALGLHEMLIRDPTADLYAIFQDDILACTGLREYLERPWRADGVYGYRNLLTYPKVEALLPHKEPGWFAGPENLGQGAQALVFEQDAVVALLSERRFVDRCLNVELDKNDRPRGQVNVDGGIASSMDKMSPRYAEFVHYPSLVTHLTEVPSSMGNRKQPEIASWVGEEFDCLTL